MFVLAISIRLTTPGVHIGYSLAIPAQWSILPAKMRKYVNNWKHCFDMSKGLACKCGINHARSEVEDVTWFLADTYSTLAV